MHWNYSNKTDYHTIITQSFTYKIKKMMYLKLMHCNFQTPSCYRTRGLRE